MIYKWKDAAYIRADPQVAGEVCERLEQTVGLTAQNLLEDSRPRDAPLHDAFEWQDHVAAENWRLQQAGHLIRCLVIEREDQPDVEPVRAFFTVEPLRYESTELILQDQEKTNTLLRTALKELSQFQKKYRQLTELAEVFKVADKVLQEVS